jgi:hypothetical protein
MASPFPGMDPYLEEPLVWPTVHFWLIAGLAETLQASLPDTVIVSVEERIYGSLTVGNEQVGDSSVPEITIRGQGSVAMGAVAATLSASVPVLAPIPEVVHERYLEIRDVYQRDRVLTIIEVLSPASKECGPGRSAYLEKRLAVLSQPRGDRPPPLRRADGRHRDANPARLPGLCVAGRHTAPFKPLPLHTAGAAARLPGSGPQSHLERCGRSWCGSRRCL